jgi:YVTN family beta-propeller protein
MLMCMTATVPPLRTIAVDQPPHWVAIAPDGRRAYVTLDDIGGSKAAVAVIDTAADTIVATIPLHILPGDIAVAPDGKRVYVSNFDQSTLSGVLSVIDTATNAVVATVTVSGQGGGPTGVAVGLDGRRVYVCNDHDVGHDLGRLTVIDTESHSIVTAIEVSDFPTAVRLTPDGRQVYVMAPGGVLAIVDTATNTASFPFTDLSGDRMAFAPGGVHAYVVGDAGTQLSVLETKTLNIVDLIDVDGLTTDVAVTPDGRHAYVTQRTGNRISHVDATTTTHVATATPIDFPGTADGLAITPDGRRAYVTNRRAQTVEVIAIE